MSDVYNWENVAKITLNVYKNTSNTPKPLIYLLIGYFGIGQWSGLIMSFIVIMNYLKLYLAIKNTWEK